MTLKHSGQYQQSLWEMVKQTKGKLEASAEYLRPDKDHRFGSACDRIRSKKEAEFRNRLAMAT